MFDKTITIKEDFFLWLKKNEISDDPKRDTEITEKIYKKIKSSTASMFDSLDSSTADYVRKKIQSNIVLKMLQRNNYDIAIKTLSSYIDFIDEIKKKNTDYEMSVDQTTNETKSKNFIDQTSTLGEIKHVQIDEEEKGIEPADKSQEVLSEEKFLLSDESKKMLSKESFYNWLGKKELSTDSFKRSQFCFSVMNNYCVSSNKISSPSIFEVRELSEVEAVVETIQFDVHFRTSFKKNLAKIDSSLKRYYEYYSAIFNGSTFSGKEEKKEIKEDRVEEIENDPENITIKEAIVEVLKNSNIPLTATEIYYEIISRNLYKFGAKYPVSVVSVTLKRACADYDYSKHEKEDVFISQTDNRGRVVFSLVNVSEKEEQKNTSSKEETHKNDETDATINSVETNKVDFNANNQLEYTVPIECIYKNEIVYGESSWRELYQAILKKLFEEYEDIMRSYIGKSFSNSMRIDLADCEDKDKLRVPVLLFNDIYVEANLSANDIIRKIKNVLVICNVDFDNLKILYRKRNTLNENLTKSVETSNDDSQETNFESSKDNTVNFIKTNEAEKSDFADWLRAYQDYAENTIISMVSAINSAGKFAVMHSFCKEPIINMRDSGEVQVVVKKLYKNPVFVKMNSTGRFTFAINKYVEYLKQKETKSIAVSDSIDETQDLNAFGKVLKEKFRNGLRPESVIDLKRFKSFYKELFGNELEYDNDSLSAKIIKCGVFYNERIYSPSVLLDEETKEKLINYIRDSFEKGINAIYFEALYEIFADDFLTQKIIDSKMLKVYLEAINEGDYVVKFSYLAKSETDILDPVKVISTLLRETPVPMQVEEIVKKLPYITEDRISAVLKSKEFIMNKRGEYFVPENFEISENELYKISRIIDEEIDYKTYISGDELVEHISAKYPELMDRWSVYTRIGIREALKYYLGKEYFFKGNIISKAGETVSAAGVFEHFSKNREQYSVEDAVALAETLGSTVYYESLLVNSVRVNQNNFVSKSLISFDVDAIDDAIDSFCLNDYVSILDIKHFGAFPDNGFQWNEWMLECYVAFYSKKYKLLHTAFNKDKCCGAIVKAKSKFENFYDVLIDDIANSNIALDKQSVLTYLIDRGYFAQKNYSKLDYIISEAETKRERMG